jgi:hypothetical protein
MTFFTCVKFLTLKMEYQKHLQTWGNLEFGPHAISNATERGHLEAKRAALEARSALREQMFEHQQLCIACQENLDAVRQALLKSP